jgi:hypothetical protein
VGRLGMSSAGSGGRLRVAWNMFKDLQSQSFNSIRFGTGSPVPVINIYQFVDSTFHRIRESKEIFCFRTWAEMSAMALLNLVLMMMMRTMINKEAQKEIEDKLRWKLKLDKVLLMRLSWISLWLSASMLLSTLRLGRWNPSELGSEPKVRTRIPNMWV